MPGMASKELLFQLHRNDPNEFYIVLFLLHSAHQCFMFAYVLYYHLFVGCALYTWNCDSWIHVKLVSPAVFHKQQIKWWTGFILSHICVLRCVCVWLFSLFSMFSRCAPLHHFLYYDFAELNLQFTYYFSHSLGKLVLFTLSQIRRKSIFPYVAEFKFNFKTVCRFDTKCLHELKRILSTACIWHAVLA